MAQKTKAAARQPRVKSSGTKGSKVKKAEAKVAASKAPAKAAVKAKAVSGKVAAPVKAVAAKTPVVKAPAAKTAPAKVSAAKAAAAKPAAKSAPEKQIESAKAALKKENVAAHTPVKAESKPRARKISIEISPNEAASALAQKWSTLYKKAEQIEAKPYNMKAIFEEKTAIMHKVLGWGYILANRNDRLEVLFKDGIKYLISNYKP